MAKVVALMSMSLDGYVADPDDGVSEVFAWYFNSGDVEFHTGGADPMTFTVSAPSAEHLRSLVSGLGAMLTGRRTFDKARGWDGNHAWGPAFVLTHQIPDGWPRPNSTVHFVTDGVESAVRQAQAAAAGKYVGVHGADTIQQLWNAGLLDEIQVDIVALLLGSGVRLFDHLAGTPAVLGNPTVIAGVGVTHLRYPVRKAQFIWLVGGAKFPLALAELGLIDEYEFVVQPRLAGHGPTLLTGLSKYVDLTFVSRSRAQARGTAV